MNRKLISGLLAVVSVSGVSLTACGGNASNGAAGSCGHHTLRLGYIMASGDPGDEGAKQFKEIVEKETDGDLEIALQGNSLLGDEKELWEGQQMGSVDMAVTGVGPISYFTPKYAGVQMYYAIRDTDHLDAVYNGEIGDEIADALLDAKGGRVLDWWHRLPREVTSNKPIRKPADLKGLKIRIPDGETYLKTWQAFGASPTPMALEELFTALEQGVVDAQENPLDLIATNSFDEVQKYVSMTDHQVAPYIVSISDRTWSKLCADQQQIVQDAATRAGTYEKKLVSESADKWRKELSDRGMTVVDDVDKKAFQDIARKTAQKLEGEGLWGKGLYDRIQKVG